MPNGKSTELSQRELDILKLVATGASNKEIAQQLFISLNTVKVHLRNIFAKIDVTSRTEAAMYAVRIGLVESISPQVSSKEEPLQDNTATSIKGGRRIAITYLGLIGGFAILLIIVGFATNWGNAFSVNPSVNPTITPRVQWFKLAGMDVARRGLAVANYENQIYAIGGDTSAGVTGITEKYDPQSNTWVTLASKPTAVTDINAAVLGGLIYVPGGKSKTGAPTDVNEIYDPQANKWTSAASLPKPLSAYALAVLEGRIYIFGGWDGKQVINNSYEYDPHSDTWSELQPMPTARSYAGSIAVAGKIYVIGGWDGEKALTANEVYPSDALDKTSRWEEGIPLPAGRYSMGITNIADIIFLIGGYGPDENLTVIALSPDSHDWGQIEAPLPSGWSNLGSVTIGTRLYALGGSTPQGFNNNLWSYQAIFTITLPIIH